MIAIAIAIPVFLATMFVEWRLLLRRGDSDYRLDDTFSNLACGIGSQIWGALTAIVSWFAYSLIYDSVQVFEWWTGDTLGWCIAILGVDFSYYWFHRISHRVRLFWSFHVVHHQSEGYNLSVALRQSWFGGFLSWVFYIPWLMLGIPPAVLVGAKLVNLLYQYWIHTRLIAQLPWGLEWVMSSPSNHRVHHGRDDRSLDTNYGGIFIIWDRIFGTYVPEESEPLYGTVSPIKSWDPVHANLEGLQKIVAYWRCSDSWGDRFRSVFGPPEWVPSNVETTSGPRESLYLSDANSQGYIAIYVLVQFFLSTGWLLWWLSGQGHQHGFASACLACSTIVGLWAWGAHFGKRYQAWRRLEFCRLIFLAVGLMSYPALGVWGLISAALLGGYGLVVEFRLRKEKGLKEATNCP